MNLKIENINLEINFLDNNNNIVIIPNKYKNSVKKAIKNIPVVQNTIKKEIRRKKLKKLSKNEKKI